MKKLLLVCSVWGLTISVVFAQKVFTREGKISFFSEAPMEKIEAHNGTVTSVLDMNGGRMEFAVLVKAFKFEKALMQEHFNENYLESDKYPKATFKGQIADFNPASLTQDGKTKVTVTGDLTIHGVTKSVSIPATLKVEKGVVTGAATFEVAVADYNIEIPSLVRDKVAKVVRIEVLMPYQPMNN